MLEESLTGFSFFSSDMVIEVVNDLKEAGAMSLFEICATG